MFKVHTSSTNKHIPTHVELELHNEPATINHVKSFLLLAK